MRPDFDEYFLGIAKAVSARGDCSRRQVGCVIVDSDRRVASTGYNGTYPNGPSCFSGGCPRAQSGASPGHNYDDPSSPFYCGATHAEANALLYADYGRLRGGAVYITEEPCYGCRKLLQAVPLSRVIWPGGEIVF